MYKQVDLSALASALSQTVIASLREELATEKAGHSAGERLVCHLVFLSLCAFYHGLGIMTREELWLNVVLYPATFRVKILVNVQNALFHSLLLAYPSEVLGKICTRKVEWKFGFYMGDKREAAKRHQCDGARQPRGKG